MTITGDWRYQVEVVRFFNEYVVDLSHSLYLANIDHIKEKFQVSTSYLAVSQLPWSLTFHSNVITELSRITVLSKLEEIRVDKWIWIALVFAVTEAKKKKTTHPTAYRKVTWLVCIFIWIVYVLSYKLSDHIYISLDIYISF